MEEGCQEEAQNKKDREEGETDEEITQEVVTGIKEEASAQEDAKSTAQRIVGQILDCSQIENEEEEEKDWQEEDQMAVLCDEEQELEEMLEGRRMEGNSLQLEVMQKVLGERSGRNKTKEESERMVY